MSVIQISRIQQRRGKKNSDFGFPQLASGELGWAIDTQELYIGNGAVSEGAPYVGNSKILTEHDDILQFVALYEYQKGNNSLITGPSEGQPINRSLQERLDDIVSIKAFGAIGDGITDDTAALQQAIDQLFLNSATKTSASSRVVLYIDPGEYMISAELKIPPFTHIVGAGIDSTIIKQTESYPIFKMVANDPNSEGTYLEFGSMNSFPERPRYILISALSLKTTTSDRLVYLDNTDSTLFDRVRFSGTYDNLALAANVNHKAVESRGTSAVFRTFNVLFNFCIFNNIGKGFYSDSDHDNVSFDHCTFDVLEDAINIGGRISGDTQSVGATNTNITNCYFDNIKKYGIYVRNGYGNISSNNKFMSVGNNGSVGYIGSAGSTYANILFESDNNQSVNDYFQRDTELRNDLVNPYEAFTPCIQNSSIIYNNNNFRRELEETAGNPIVFLRLPLFDSGMYIIDYIMKKNNKRTSGGFDITGTSAIRSGTISVSVDVTNATSTITDNYQYQGHSSVEDIVFSAELHNYKTGDTIPPTLPLDTLTINLYNPSRNGMGTMNCVYRMMTK